ncbi:MAG: hypothetical protein Q9204_008308 [Flavoplaca sp. TL-2023a]
MRLAHAPVITLRGLCRPTGVVDYPITKSLICHVTEPRPFLTQFGDQIYRTFVAHDFVPFVIRTSSKRKRILLNIMETGHRLRTDMFIQGASRHLGGKYVAPNFDASDLHTKYENYSWTEEFPLEKLCLSQLGQKDFWRDGKVVRTGYHDIACVPLPGVVSASINCELSDEEYTSAAYVKTQNQPVTPRLIPSTPPPRVPDTLEYLDEP